MAKRKRLTVFDPIGHDNTDPVSVHYPPLRASPRMPRPRRHWMTWRPNYARPAKGGGWCWNCLWP